MEALQYIIIASDKSKGSIVPVQCTLTEYVELHSFLTSSLYGN